MMMCSLFRFPVVFVEVFISDHVCPSVNGLKNASGTHLTCSSEDDHGIAAGLKLTLFDNYIC
eukprot:scaffold27971_cov83-Skeletonema_dohrnii-CCMP3373.AAC.3